MPRVVHGERPGMVFNVSYGLQGQARYTHVPSILEMVGVPYVASGPLAHSLALDKVVTKMILRQHGLPTPDFAVLDSVEPRDLQLDYSAPRDAAAAAPIENVLNLEQVEKETIERALHKHGFNISHAAKELGLTRASLYRRMEKHGL